MLFETSHAGQSRGTRWNRRRAVQRGRSACDGPIESGIARALWGDWQLSATASTAADLVCAVGHGDLLSPDNMYYSLWNYSLYRISIVLRMQQHRRSRTVLPTAEALFGQALRDLRKEKGMSQEALAFESGYHPTYIGQLERGKKSPSLRTIVRLAGALKTRGSEMLKRVEAGGGG